MSEAFDVPDEAGCPDCGGDPTDESVQERRLSDLGYLSGECPLVCEDCGNEWLLGVPVGEFERGDDLVCPACEKDEDAEGTVYYMVHRVDQRPPDPPDEWDDFRRETVLDMEDPVLLHLKCPRCFHMPTGGGVYRDADDRGIALVGFPPITGTTDGVRAPYGYREE